MICIFGRSLWVDCVCMGGGGGMQSWKQGDLLGSHCSGPEESWWWPGLSGDNGGGRNCQILEVFFCVLFWVCFFLEVFLSDFCSCFLPDQPRSFLRALSLSEWSLDSHSTPLNSLFSAQCLVTRSLWPSAENVTGGNHSKIEALA